MTKFPVAVRALVDEFTGSTAATDAHYKEDWIRSEYIEPLFGALGWSRLNPSQLTNRSTGFVREAPQHSGTSTTSPDYGFYVAGTRVLFVEAKRPAARVQLNRKAAYQLRRYGWNAGHPVGVLTDFNDFAVYDCRLQPEEDDDASTGRIDYLTCTEYEARWQWLVGQFSPPAIEDGSLFGLVSQAKKHRKLRPVDAAFLEEIEGWRAQLAQSILKDHPDLGSRDLNFAVQATIDRVVFLRIAEARGLEEQGALAHIAGLREGLYKRLLALFERADTRYNSGLFHFRKEQGREDPDTLTPILSISDRVLRGILGRLADEAGPYEFAVMPADILGQVYEQFLGRVISVEGRARVEIAEKPEVRKAGGVYYTPTFVVDYIVAQTLDPILAGRSLGQVEKIRVIDPACGSGSFLIAAYQHLLDWYLERYKSGGNRYRRFLTTGADGRRRLTLEARKTVLLRHVYGVDIDPQAVEVAKLSLLLKVIEGETQMALSVGRLLPDLDETVRCGNSLVGPEFFGTAQLIAATPDEHATINPFDWDASFPEVMRAGGFDAVIGNPPWLMAGYYVADSMPYLRQHYASCHGKADLYYLFLEKACRIVRGDGRIGMIVPNKLFHTKAASTLREMLSRDNWIESIVDFGTERIFAGATNYSCILLLRKGGKGRVPVTIASNRLLRQEHLEVERDQLGAQSWNLFDATRVRLWRKVEAAGQPLQELVSRFGTGIQTGADRILIVTPDEARAAGLEDELLQPILKGRSVRRYCQEARHLVIFPYVHSGAAFELMREAELKRRAPVLYRYLISHKEKLAARVWFGKSATELSGAWYGMMYLEPAASFSANHLVTPSLSDRGNFAVGTGELFVTGTAGVTSLVLRDSHEEDPLYLTALLNSRLLSTYAVEHSTPYQGGYFKFSGPYLRDLPVRRIDSRSARDRDRHDSLVGLASRLTELYASREAATGHSRTVTDRAIESAEFHVDRIVYELYALDDEEISTIHGDELPTESSIP